jgi:hypothetical protein
VATPIEVASTVLLADPEFSIDLSTTTFPFTIPPGENRRIPVLYAPTAEVVNSGTLTVTHSAGDPLVASVRGEGMAGEIVVEDLTFFAYDGAGLTQVIEFNVPDEAVSISVFAVDFFSSLMDIVLMEGPEGKVYEDGDFDGPWFWWDAYPGGATPASLGAQGISAQIPQRDGADAQLIDGGGIYRIQFQGDPAVGGLFLRIVLELRRAGVVREGTLDVNVYFAPATGLDHTTAPTDSLFQQVLQRCDQVLGGAGVRLGEVHYYTLPALYDDLPTDADIDALWLFGPFDATPGFASGQQERLNVYFVNSILGGTLLGVSAAPSPKPGPLLTSEFSGLAIEWGTSSLQVGATMAHEIGHSLGIVNHTVDDFGSGVLWDRIDDTLECPLFGTDELCLVEGNNYLMHPFDLGPDGILVTEGQRRVMTRAAFTRPGLPAVLIGSPLLASNAPAVPPALTAAVLSQHSNRCGTCRRAAQRFR